jgi:hypothetical protein
VSDFKIENGQIQGTISTGGEKETFGQTWDVDLTFNKGAVTDFRLRFLESNLPGTASNQ